jgi:hypothetical protein
LIAAVPLEDPAHLIVLELLEAVVPFANRKQHRRSLQDDELVSLSAEERGGLWRGHGGCDDNGASSPCAGGAHRREHRGTGGETVIDEHHSPATECQRAETRTVNLLAP